MTGHCTKCGKQLGHGSKHDMCVQCRKICPVCGGPRSAYAKTCMACRDTTGNKNSNYRHGLQCGGKKHTTRELIVKLIVLRDRVCERCGCDNLLALVIHHKNRDRRDNTWDNLELLCANCHASEHASKWRQEMPAYLDEIVAALSAEPPGVILGEWTERPYGPDGPTARKVCVWCPGCGDTREVFKNGYVKANGFCNRCNQIRRAYGGMRVLVRLDGDE